MEKPHRAVRRAAAGPYVLATALCLLILAWVLRLWNADLSIPFVYAEDDMLSLAVIKGMVENGWYLRNPSIGMPTGLSFYDFAAPDTLHFLLIKGIAFATRDAVSARNLYFLLTFPLTTLCALFALRRWGIAAGPAVVASLLYAFTPYHLLRGTTHLFLSAYYLLPLAAILFLWVSQGEELLLTRTPDGRWRPTWNRKTAFGLAVCVLLGMGGVYYAFFACFFFLVAAAADVLRRQCRHGVYRAGLLILVIGGTVVANLLPAILYHRAHGKNPEAAHRTRVDAEYYGLRMTQMLLPVSLHRVRPLAVVKERYNQLAPMVNENDCV